MDEARIRVYYDGACPRCLRELAIYRRLDRAQRVEWFDIVGQEAEVERQGIDPDEALKKLHIRMPDGRIIKDIDAFIVLWREVPVFRPLAAIIGIPRVKSVVERLYERIRLNRLRRQGRLCDEDCAAAEPAKGDQPSKT